VGFSGLVPVEPRRFPPGVGKRLHFLHATRNNSGAASRLLIFVSLYLAWIQQITGLYLLAAVVHMVGLRSHGEG
jgi:hypothetical protein